MRVLVLIALEGAVDRFCGRPRDRNPYCRENARDEFSSWDLGWTEADQLLDLRGQEETQRWLRESA
jgi:hypothetical protein